MLTRSPISWFHKIALRSRTIQLLFLVMMLVPVHTVSGQSSLPSWFITPPEYTSAAIFASSDEEAIANAAKVLAAFERSIVWGNFRTFYDSSIDTDTWFDTDYFYYIPVAEIERIQQGLQVMASTVVSVLPSTRLFLVGKQGETMPNWEMELTADAVRPQWVDALRFEKDGFIFGVGVCALKGTIASAWVKAEEKAIYEMLVKKSMKLGIISEKTLSETDETFLNITWVDLKYVMENVKIMARWFDAEKDLCYVLVSAPSEGIRRLYE